MKTSEEMASSVLCRAKQEKQIRNRRRKITAVSALCACCLVLTAVAVAGPNREEPQLAVQVQQSTARTKVMVVNNGSADSRSAELIRDVRMPYKVMIRVWDVAGLSDAELERVEEEEQRFAEDIWGLTDYKTASHTCWGSENVLISIVTVEQLFLVVDDYDQIADYEVETTEMGYIDTFGEIYKEESGADLGLSFGWTLSNKAVEMIEKDPAVKLSTFSDTITVTVKFKDETQEKVVVDMQVEDDGQVYAVHRGTER